MTASSTANAPLTHGCARCGAPVAMDVGLCERCNPLGLRDSASSQVHGTAILGVGAAVAVLAIAAHLAVGGIGPFTGRVTGTTAGSTPGSVVATVEIRNTGRSAGSATCRLSDPRDASQVSSVIVYTPRIEPGATVSLDQQISVAGADRTLQISCSTP